MLNKWSIRRISDIIEINPRESLIKGITAKKISMDVLRPFCRDISKYELTEYSGGVKFRNGDTIMARITPCLENGKTAKVNILDDNEVGFGSTEYIVFRSKEGITDEDFVYYLVCSPLVRDPAIKSMVGSSGRQRVQIDVLKNLEISVPDIDTQRKIGSLLKLIDDKIAMNTKINENLEQQAHALFKDMIADVQKKVPFSSIIQVLGGGTPKTGKQEYWNGEIPFFTPKDVGNPYVFTTEKNITPLGLDNCNSRLYLVNTVFLTARGTVGKVSLAGMPMAMNQSCYALVGKDKLHQIVVYNYVLETVKSLKHKASGAVFDAIITRDFDTEYIADLSPEQMGRFVAITEPIYDEILNRSFENQRLASLRDTLLSKLMSGEINVSEVKI